MANFNICPICKEAIEVEKYRDHFKAHNKKEDRLNPKILEKILDDAQKSWEIKGNKNPVSLFFEVAKKIFAEIEKVDTSSWNYVFDTDFPNMMSDAKILVPSPYPPVMCHIKFVIKDKGKFDELIKKHKGTEKEHILKYMVSTNIPTVVVYKEELNRLILEWKSKGSSNTEVMALTVFFFLHEMYHILGFGEKDSSVKASIATLQSFGIKIGIPEHEIQRWKLEEELKKRK